MGRKPHVWVSQDSMLDALREVGPSHIDDIAEFLDVSPMTVRRKLDGAVHQGKAVVWEALAGPNSPGRCYGALDDDGRIVAPEGTVVLDPRLEAEARRQETLDRLEGRST